jgi:hypothetical protein
MFSSSQLKKIITEIRPIIERQLDDAQLIAGFRNTVAEQGGDWSALKALVKAHIKDERDEAGDGKHVRAILERAEYSSVYADMLGWANMNENNFSSDNSLPEATVKGEADGTLPRIASPAVPLDNGRYDYQTESQSPTSRPERAANSARDIDTLATERGCEQESLSSDSGEVHGRVSEPTSPPNPNPATSSPPETGGDAASSSLASPPTNSDDFDPVRDMPAHLRR